MTMNNTHRWLKPFDQNQQLVIPSIKAEFMIKRLLLFAILLSWCGLLIALRMMRSHSTAFFFLTWNLFLAAIPMAAAWGFARSMERRSAIVVQGGWFAMWLAFLPNAPYLVTDLMHLHSRPPVPVWYDIALLVSCAGTGLLLGYCSLADVQHAIARRFSVGFSWLVVFATLLLSGFGMYLGRFLRWNSWDAITQPTAVFADIADRVLNPTAHPRTVTFTLIFGAGLLVGYVALRLLGLAPTASSFDSGAKQSSA